MIDYILIQAVSAIAVLLVGVLAVRRYKSRTEFAFRTTLAAMEASASAALGEANQSNSLAVGLNGHPISDNPGIPAARF